MGFHGVLSATRPALSHWKSKVKNDVSSILGISTDLKGSRKAQRQRQGLHFVETEPENLNDTNHICGR